MNMNKAPFKSNGHLDENGLSAYAEYMHGKRSEVSDEIKVHVELCAVCREALMDISDLLTETEGVALDELTINVKSSAQQSWKVVSRIAVAIAAVLLLSWFIQQLLPDADPTEPMAGETEDGRRETEDGRLKTEDGRRKTAEQVPVEVVTPHDTIRYAEAFVPNEKLEVLIKSGFRNEEEPGLRLSDTAVDHQPGDTLVFNWRGESDVKVAIVVLNNREMEQIRILPDESGEMQWVLEMEPGLYYWKLVTETEMVELGKIRLMHESSQPSR